MSKSFPFRYAGLPLIVTVSLWLTLEILILSTALISRMPTPDKHDTDHGCYPREASYVSYFMGADKLAAAVLATVIPAIPISEKFRI
jgi:hypothetical protein